MIQIGLMIACFIVVKFIQIIYRKEEENLTKGLAVVGIIAVIVLCVFMVDSTGEVTKYLE